MVRTIALGTLCSAMLIGCGSKSQLRIGARAPEIDAGVDAAHAMDASSDASTAPDVSTDTSIDARDAAPTPRDAGDDVGLDVGVDAGTDVGVDASTVVARIGCADGQREGYRDVDRYPDIAACAGGWDHPGVAHAAPTFCDREAGDDGARPGGEGCGVADLCEPGFHVCLGPSDVDASSVDGCAGSHDALDSFFVTRMSSSGCGVCATGTSTTCTAIDCRTDCAQTSATTNDVFGCGTLGHVPSAATCGVLDRFSDNLCSALTSPWSCADDGSGTHEAELLVKPGPAHGGVLCCRD